MTAKLQEALAIVSELMADVEGRYPVGLVRVHRLLTEVLEADPSIDDEIVSLDAEPPFPAA